MSPPAKKRRKTAAGSATVTGTRRTTRSQRPGLSLEMIGKMATFASYDDGDMMNICLAVGPTDAAVVRYTCLRKNMDFLRYTVRQFASKVNAQYDVFWHKSRVNINTWMAVNTDWGKLCTKERTEDDELSTARYDNEEGEIGYRTDPLIIFNNPAVAIEFGLVDVLKHLVEEVGIDINACKWSGCYLREKYHLLYLSYWLSSHDFVSKSIFEYFVSREDVNANAQIDESEDVKLVWHGLLHHGSNLAPFEAVVRHRSFDPNQGCDIGGLTTLPLHQAITCVVCWAGNPRTVSIAMGKVEVLLKAGADPERAIDGSLSPLRCVQAYIQDEGEQSEKGKVCKALISMMEKYIN